MYLETCQRWVSQHAPDTRQMPRGEALSYEGGTTLQRLLPGRIQLAHFWAPNNSSVMGGKVFPSGATLKIAR